MSLAITLANQYGIVMSADRRITTTVTRSETNETESFVLTEHEQKLFLTKAGHGISYTGASSLAGGRRTACIIRKTLAQLEECLSLEDEILSVKKELQAFANGRNVILIGAAICDEKNRVLSSSLTTDEITEHLSRDDFQANVCLNYGGRDEILRAVRQRQPETGTTRQSCRSEERS